MNENLRENSEKAFHAALDCYAIISICDVSDDCFYFIFWWTDDFSWNDESWRIDWFF